MKNFKISKFVSSIALMLVLALSACGGSGGSSTIDQDPNEETPESSIVLQNTDSIPEKISSGQTYSISLKINNTTAEPLLFELNWGDGSEIDARTFEPGEHEYSREKIFNVADTTTFEWQARLLSSSTNEQITSVSGSVLVEALPSAPVLQLLNTPPAAQTNASAYALQFEASDKDADLVVFELEWADQSAAESKEAEGTTDNASFARNFTKAGTYSWTALVRDAGGRDSETLNGSVKVTMVTQPPAPNAPSLALKGSANSTALTQTTHELAFDAADKDGDLQILRLRWSDETADRTLNVSTAAASVKLTRAFSQVGTFTWSARVSDVGGRTSTPVTGQVVVTAPPPTDIFTLPPAKTKSTVKLLANKECSNAQNEFFDYSITNKAVEARRRYIFESVLAVKSDGSGFDPQASFDKLKTVTKDAKTSRFAAVSMMFHQGQNSLTQAETDKWYDYANQIAQLSIPPSSTKLPFQQFQIMDTYMRWNCHMTEFTKLKIREYITSRNFGYEKWGTDNLMILNAYTRYLAGLAWPNLASPLGTVIKDITVPANDPTGINFLKSRSKKLYQTGSGEWASQPYDAYNIIVHMSLAQLSPDKELATLSHLAHQAIMARYASAWVKGLLATSSLRDYPPFKGEMWGLNAYLWFHFGGKRIDTSSDFHHVGAAINYNLPNYIYNIPDSTKNGIMTETIVGQKRNRLQGYVRNNIGVFSWRTPTVDGGGTSFVPGTTTPPGVVWASENKHSNFFIGLTDSPEMAALPEKWSFAIHDLLFAKRGHQYLQLNGTLLMVTDNYEGIFKQTDINKHRIFGILPKPSKYSIIDASCAVNSCLTSVDNKNLYQVLYSLDDTVLVAITSSHPFAMMQDNTSNWKNSHSFTIPLNHQDSLASAVAVEAEEYSKIAGVNATAKLAKFKQELKSKIKFKFNPPTSEKNRSALEYTNIKGEKFYKEYINKKNAPYWRTKGWGNKSDPNYRALEISNNVPIDHVNWPAIKNDLTIQKIIGNNICPLYVFNKTTTTWMKIWDENYLIAIDQSLCAPG